MNEIDHSVTDTQAVTPADSAEPMAAEPVAAENTPSESESRPVDPVRSAAGRLGGHRVHVLAVLGREYEKEHGLTPGRERLKHLIKLGKRYEVEHGLRTAKARTRKKGDAWQEFVSALARVVKPVHRAAVEQLASALRPNSTPVADRAA